MAETDSPTEIADFTHGWMRRVETKLDKVLEILVRPETRITRMERDIGEIKFDLTSFDTRMVTLTTDMLRLTDKVDSIDRRTEATDRRVANIEGKLNISAARQPDQTS
jgi:hypothetical protein